MYHSNEIPVKDTFCRHIVCSNSCCFSRRKPTASKEAAHLSDLVDVALSKIGLNNDDIERARHQNDFVLFSSGNSAWDVVQNDEKIASFSMAWNARLFISNETRVTIKPRDAPAGKLFAENLKDELQQHSVQANITPIR